MNKAELIEAIAKDADLTKAEAKRALDSITDNITQTLKDGGQVSLVGFGTFKTSERAERNGINPATKQPLKIEAKTVAKWKASPTLLG